MKNNTFLGNMNRKLIKILACVIGMCGYQAKAQTPLLFNQGGNIFVGNNGILMVQGTVQVGNDGGTPSVPASFTNTGTVFVEGDWINNSTGTCFTSNNVGKVHLFGGAAVTPTPSLYNTAGFQKIGGTFHTNFNNLILEGAGTAGDAFKEVVNNGLPTLTQLNVSIDNELQLNDREFRLNDNRCIILSTDPNAIKRSFNILDNSLDGYISTDAFGRLQRSTNLLVEYIFPLGHSGNSGTTPSNAAKYRPIGLIPKNTGSTYSVRMANFDATVDVERWDRTTKQDTICEINPEFFHLIDYVGSDLTDIKMYYLSTDPIIEKMANFKDNGVRREWTSLGVGDEAVSGAFTTKQVSDYLIDTQYPAFALSNSRPQAAFTATTIGPDGNIKTVTPTDNEIFKTPYTIVCDPTNFSSNTGALYCFDFGDGTPQVCNSDPDFSGFEHAYAERGIYTIIMTVTNGNICPDVDSLQLKVNDIFRVFVPTGMSEGNQFFSFMGYINVDLLLFDRWGLLVRQLQVPNPSGEYIESPWDLTDENGKPVQEDAYAFRMECTRPDGTIDVRVGTITVLR